MAEPTITGHSIGLVYIHVSFATKRLNHHHLWHGRVGGYTVARVEPSLLEYFSQAMDSVP